MTFLKVTSVLALFAVLEPSHAVAQSVSSSSDTAPTCSGDSKSAHDADCETMTSKDEDFVSKRLPAGLTMRTASGAMFKTMEPTIVRFVRKRALHPNSQSERPQVEYCHGLSSNGRAFLDEDQSGACPSDTDDESSSHASTLDKTLSNEAIQPQLTELYRLAETQIEARSHPKFASTTTADLWQLPPVSSLHTQGQIQAKSKRQRANVTTLPKRVSTHAILPAARAILSPCEQGVEGVPTAVQTWRSDAEIDSDLRYVQVGAFRSEMNAAETIECLSGLGFPVSSQTLVKMGVELKSILAGPFETSQEAMTAQDQIRAVGYSDAFARK